MNDRPLFTQDFDGDLRAWLIEQAQKNAYTCLLAHADDGVIWGRFADGKLHLSGDAFSEVAVKLRVETLQQARLFGASGELFIWRADDRFDYRIWQDGDDRDGYLEENYRLWGQAERSKNGFTLMVEGKEGLLHAVPVEIGANQRAVLCVRHSIEYVDHQAVIVIVDSRLVSVQQGKE